MFLPLFWYLAIALLFGVGLLAGGMKWGMGGAALLANSGSERRLVLHAAKGGGYIVASLAAASFALWHAFPQGWSALWNSWNAPATLFALLLLLRELLLLKGLRGEAPSAALANTVAVVSLLLLFLTGLLFLGLLAGLPLSSEQQVVGNSGSFFSLFALWGGCTTLLFFLLHGTAWFSISGWGNIAERLLRAVPVLWLATIFSSALFFGWTLAQPGYSVAASSPLFWIALAGMIVGMALLSLFHDQRRAAATLYSSLLTMASSAALFLTLLFPNIVPSNRMGGWGSLTIDNSAASLQLLERGLFWLIPLLLIFLFWTAKTARIAGRLE